MSSLTDSGDKSSLWLDAIKTATEGLFGIQRRSSVPLDPSKSLNYLLQLEQILVKIPKKRWNQSIRTVPPPFTDTPQGNQDSSSPSSVTSPFSSNNPYSAFRNQDDDDEDMSASDADQETDNAIDYDEEAGDGIVVNTTEYSIRRLVLRVLSSQSEVYGRLAQDAGFGDGRPQWCLGADHLASAVQVLLRAVSLADEQLSQWMSQEQQTGTHSLQADAEVLSLALHHYTRKEEQFRNAAITQERRLANKLAPQWHSRDEVKQRWGERWKTNPHPKQDFARQRKRDEAELRDLQRALVTLQNLTETAKQLQDTMQQLKEQLSSGGEYHRYNGIRPSASQRRVSLHEYPDPTTYGWTFTGSNESSRVEFFEKITGDSSSLVKLDWYYTTATIKTSLDHPRQGRKQLFGAKVTPEVYRQILENPRAHTNVRYHTRNNRNRNRGGRGRHARPGRNA